MVQTALALGARAPQAHAPESVAVLLEELLAAPGSSVDARLRLEEGLARLHGAMGGEGADDAEWAAQEGGAQGGAR